MPKSSTHESLLDAIRVVLSGERYFHPFAASVGQYYRKEESAERSLFQEFTDREQEVFSLSAKGYTSREIGEKLIISPKTVDTYRQRAFEKLDIEHRSDWFVLRQGWAFWMISRILKNNFNH